MPFLTPKTQEKLIILKFSIIVLLICIVNVRSTIDGFYNLYGDPTEGSDFQESTFYRNVEGILNYAPINFFLSYTGLESGYGFFAPNVASEFVTDFVLKDECGEVIEETAFVSLECKESFIRIGSAYVPFMDYLKETEESSHEISDVILKGLSLDLLRSNIRAHEIKTTLYLYHHPTLAELRANSQAGPRVIPVKTVHYRRADLWKDV